MKKYFKKVTTVFLATVLIMAQFSFVTASTKDYTGHWAEATINKWLDLGVVNGYPDGSFKPGNSVSRAEFVTMIDNLFEFQVVGTKAYSDVSSTAWYYNAVVKASEAGIVQGNNNMFRPNALISRQEAAIVLSNAFRLSAANKTAYLKFADSSKVAAWAGNQVSALVENGYMVGFNNELNPVGNLTRAEALTLISNIAGELVSGTVTGTYTGNVVINKENTVIKDAVISGSVYIAQGVGEGDVTFDHVTIAGDVFAFGGGANTVTFNNSIVEGRLIVVKVGGAIRILAEGSTELNEVLLLSGAKLEELNLTGTGFGDVTMFAVGAGESIELAGDFEEVNIEAPVANFTQSSGTIGTLTVKPAAVGSTITISEGATVTNLVLNARTDIEGTGTITNAAINVDGSTFTITPAETVIADDISATIAGEVLSGDVTSVPTVPSSGGGGGSSTSTVSLTFDLQSGAVSHPVTVSALSTAGYTTILNQLLTAVNGEFDTIYSDYIAAVNTAQGSFLIDMMSVITYAEQTDLDGTLFADVPLNTLGGEYTDDEKKATIQGTLDIILANVTNLDTVQADLTAIAEGIDFNTVLFNGQQFKSITVIDKADATVASYVQGGDKALFIDALFGELEALTMTSNITYTMTAVLADDSTRVATMGTN